MIGTDALGLDPLRDIRHREAVAARDQSDWLKWLELDNFSPRTLYEYERKTSALLRAFPYKPFTDFTDGDLAHVLAQHPPKSRAIAKAAYNNWFSWGYKQRRIPANPVDLLPSMKYRVNRRYDVFSIVESEALCALPYPDGALCTILLWTGLRRAEARFLTGKRVDFQQRQLLVLEGAKGSKQRTVPLFDRSLAAFNDLIVMEGIGPDQFFWYSRPGGGRMRHDKAVSDTTFERAWWKRCLNDAGVRFRTPHTTRHTFATRLRELGLPIDDIQRLLGHEHYSTTVDTYIHADSGARADRFREAVSGL